MNKKDLIKEMVSVADHMDKVGMNKEANILDKIIKKIADDIPEEPLRSDMPLDEDKMIKQYLRTILWAENDDGGEPLDKNYNVTNFSDEALQKAKEDCIVFIQKAGELLEGLDMGNIGHDFWLTRNGHGAGFWDGDYPEDIGNKLTDISHEFGESNAYVGDDGKIYLS